jgi:hypothetical protein
VHLPDSTQYTSFLTRLNAGTAHVATVWWKLSDQAKITGGDVGNVRIDLKDANSIIQHVIFVEIIPVLPPPPEVIILDSIYEARHTSVQHQNLVASVSDSSLVTLSRNSTYLGIYTLKPGDVEIYLKDSNGVHKYTYQLHIQAKPTPQSYSVDLLSGDSTTLHLPESTYNYDVEGEGDWIFEKNTQYETSFYFRIKTIGTYTIRLVNKTTRFDAYVITITSEPQRESYVLNVSDNLAVW